MRDALDTPLTTYCGAKSGPKIVTIIYQRLTQTDSAQS